MFKTLVIKDDPFFFFVINALLCLFVFFLIVQKKKENLRSVIYDIQSPCSVCRKPREPTREELEIGSCASQK